MTKLLSQFHVMMFSNFIEAANLLAVEQFELSFCFSYCRD